MNWYKYFKQIEASKMSFEDIDENNAYDIFSASYQKATGKAWEKGKFIDRARNWIFYGDDKGWVTVRPQGTELLKLTGMAGHPKSILTGFNELIAENKPIWGMVSSDLASIAEKKGFKALRGKKGALILKLVMNQIDKATFGGVENKVNWDGSVTFNYNDIGETDKIFIGNNEYFVYLKTKTNYLDKVPNFVLNWIFK